MKSNQNYYANLSIVSAKKPANTHLWWEHSTYGLILVDSVDQTKLYISTDKGDNWSEIDLSDNTNSYKIQAGWLDGNDLWLVMSNNDGTADDFEVFFVELDDSNDCNPVGVGTTTTVNECYVYDIVKIGTDYYVLLLDTIGRMEMWEVDAAPLVEVANLGISDDTSYSLSFGVVNGTDAYFVGYYGEAGNDDIETIKFASATDTLSYLFVASLDGYTAPTRSQQGLSYDGSDLLYLIATTDPGGVDTLITYSIVSDVWAVQGAFPLAIMADRNTATGIREKAFHLTEFKIYQLQENSIQFYLIATPATDAVIIAITDNYFMNTQGDMWELQDAINLISSLLIDHQIEEGSVAFFTQIKDSIPVAKNMLFIFRYEYTTATTTSEEIIFEGVVTNFTEDQMQTVTLISPAKKEIKMILPSGDYTKDSDGLISQLIIDYNNYVTEGTLSDGGDLGTISLGGVLTEETIFDGCAKFDGFEWYFNPVGAIFYNNGTVDSGVDYTQASVLSGVKISHVHEEYNRIKVRGAYVDGVQVESAWQEDLDSQLRLGINERIFLISFLDTIALCNTAASNILTILAKDPLRVKFTVKDTTKGYVQVGETITFEYATSGKTVASDQFIITSATINKYGDIRYTIVSELS